MDWLYEEEYKDINDKEPSDDNYDPKPDQIDNIFWLCGSTGMGKTKTDKLLHKEGVFVHYESALCTALIPL